MSARAVEPVTSAPPRSTALPGATVNDKTGIYRNFGKRVIDIVLVCLSAVFVVPIVALLAVLISLDGGAPIYRQERIGQEGRRFQLLKLRTMIPDAEEVLARMLRDDPALEEEWNATQKLRNDPRVTRLGRMLRASSLDELPQFWNVFRGEMSLVGPRPMMPDQRALYSGAVYCDLRPGVTGLWQVSARNAEGFSSRVDYDKAYDEKLSLPFDIALMFKTIRVVLRGTGC
jgi:lipopolysaccharide/colanic/teichoic acid biosynthesis glycosyltransferase